MKFYYHPILGLQYSYLGGRILSEAEVQDLRERAKAYRDKGGEYLQRVEGKLYNKTFNK